MFKNARMKLMGWYLLVIMLVSVFFSVVIYKAVIWEIERSVHRMPARLQRMHPELRNIGRDFYNDELLIAKRRVLLGLLGLNGTIFVFSVGSGYFLAGKALEPLEKAHEEQRRFVADASHELRTPLTSLMAMVEIARRDKGFKLKDARKLMDQSLEEIEDMNRLISDLLDLSKFESGSGGLKLEKINFGKIVEKSIRRISLVSSSKKIIVRKSVDEGLVIKGDAASLNKMVMVLLDNSIKYTDKGGKVFVEAYRKGKCVYLKVRDTGIGMERKAIPRVFDRFYRVEKSRSKIKARGFGLGLSIAKNIVELHSGKISVKSKLGKGTTFTVKLPISS